MTPVLDPEVVFEGPTFEDHEIDTTTPQSSGLTAALLSASKPTGRIGCDTIDIRQLRGLQFFWLAGYVGGWWPTYHPMCVAYPALYKAGRIFSYAVNAGEDADWCDCEKGDLTVAQVGPWLARQFARGHKRPGVYANLDTWTHGGLKAATDHYGDRIVRIVAWYTFRLEIAVPWADVQQVTDKFGGRNVDGNVARDSLFGVAGPPPANPLHYDWLPDVAIPTPHWGSLSERQVVLHYDGARQHPIQYKDYLPVLQSQLQWLANHVWGAAHHPLVNGKPTWAKLNRGWRYQQLARRAHGQQFVQSKGGPA